MRYYGHLMTDEQGNDVIRDLKTNELIPIENVAAYIPLSEMQREQELRQQRKDMMELTQYRKDVANSSGKFFWFSYFVNTPIFPHLNDSTVARIFYLASFISYKGYLITKGNKIITMEHIPAMLNISKREYGRFVDDTFGGGIFFEEDGKVYINDTYFNIGEIKTVFLTNRNDCNVMRIHSEAIQQMFETLPVKSHKKLGQVLRTIPFTNWACNILSYNPDETNLDCVECMPIREALNLWNMTDNNMAKLIKSFDVLSFTRQGNPVKPLYVVGNPRLKKKATVIAINPWLFCAGDRVETISALRQKIKELDLC